MVLNINEGTCLEMSHLMQSVDVVVPRQANLRHRGILQKPDDGRCQSDDVQTEQETEVVGSHLQQGDAIECTL